MPTRCHDVLYRKWDNRTILGCPTGNNRRSTRILGFFFPILNTFFTIQAGFADYKACTVHSDIAAFTDVSFSSSYTHADRDLGCRILYRRYRSPYIQFFGFEKETIRYNLSFVDVCRLDSCILNG